MILHWKKRLARTRVLIFYFYPFIVFYRKLYSSKYGKVIPKENPFFTRKFTSPYLATFITTRQRLLVQSNHCDFIDQHFCFDNFFINLKNGITLWSLECESNKQSILIKMPGPTAPEGDMVLEYELNSHLLHRLTFSFVQGSLLGMQDIQVVFIGGSQGFPGNSALIRSASRSNGEISPATAIVIAIKAISKTINIENILGVKTAYQLSLCSEPNTGLSSYNDLWIKNYGEECSLFYVMSTNAYRDVSESVSGSHHSRTRRKRKAKMNLMNTIMQEFKRYLVTSE